MTVELMVDEPDAVVIAARVLAAGLMGAVLGLEREWRGKEAGLRTNTLIAIGAALFASMSLASAGDPGRIAAQVVTGVGFLGAGAIMRTGANVHGLTTAALIWVNAAIGVAAGFGQLRLAAMCTGITLAAMLVLIPLDRRFEHRKPSNLVPPDA
ncbi:MAG TPA: MgtC/SapB family protein [Vicinamibacterales bacterium]